MEKTVPVILLDLCSTRGILIYRIPHSFSGLGRSMERRNWVIWGLRIRNGQGSQHGSTPKNLLRSRSVRSNCRLERSAQICHASRIPDASGPFLSSTTMGVV